nr:spore germination protein [Paenibacillus campinasensis]
MVSLTSFGVPYLSPFVPLRFSDMRDVFIRVPWPFLKTRPDDIKPHNQARQK